MKVCHLIRTQIHLQLDPYHHPKHKCKGIGHVTDMRSANQQSLKNSQAVAFQVLCRTVESVTIYLILPESLHSFNICLSWLRFDYFLNMGIVPYGFISRYIQLDTLFCDQGGRKLKGKLTHCARRRRQNSSVKKNRQSYSPSWHPHCVWKKKQNKTKTLI